MATEVLMPKLGLTMEEGRIVRWLKQEGDQVAIGEILFELETDKTTLEYESQAAGTLLKILVTEDVVVPVATLVGYIGEPTEDITEALSGKSIPESEETVSDIIAAGPQPPKHSGSTHVRATPRARALAKKLGIPIECVEGTQEDGRISEDDVNAYQANQAVTAEKPESKDAAASIPYDGIRRKIGEQLKTSFSEKPHIFQSVEVDMQNVVNIRNANKTREGSPSISDYIVFACAAALKEYPQVNSLLVNDLISQYGSINIGYAVDTPKGLMAPVIKNCESLSLKQLAGERKRLVSGAIEGKLMPDDYADGTFTVSSLGSFGIRSFTSIINPPQTAILSVAALEDRVVARDGNIVIRPCMNLTMASDHRIIDGAMAARTLIYIKEFLEREKNEETD